MKISFSLRAFVVYFLILGSLLWFTLDNAIERLNDGMRQSAESVMVDIAHLLASLIEQDINDDELLPTGTLGALFDDVKQRTLTAKIYQITKTEVDTDVYITDAEGIVVYDSNGEAVGEDYSQWRDVRLTLDDEYGARTSYKDQTKTEPDDEKVMIIAAPVRHQGHIIGAVSVMKSINSLEGYLLTESNQLKRYGLMLLLAALIIGYIVSMWFTASLKKISSYADTMAAGQPTNAPVFFDQRFTQLADSINHMRQQLDGKEYVENYIHSLTHELKTPITSIRGAVELLDEDMPAADRTKFIDNINTSNRRMARLVDKMLSLAKLEGLTELVNPSHFDFSPTLKRLILEREPIVVKRRLRLNSPSGNSLILFGDKLLISQAVANLLDNAIDFCVDQGVIDISVQSDERKHIVRVHNQGSPIPDFALDRIYERFFSLPRPDNDQTRTDKSTGLGLSFVQEIMKLHRGSVIVTNTDNGVQAELRWPNHINH